jgi:hypothetical protein
MAIHAIFAIIADGGRAIILIYREAGRNKLISYSLYKFILNPSTVATSTPCKEATGGVVCSSIKSMPLEGETAPSWWRCFCVCVQLAKTFPSGTVFRSCQNGLGVEAVK